MPAKALGDDRKFQPRLSPTPGQKRSEQWKRISIAKKGYRPLVTSYRLFEECTLLISTAASLVFSDGISVPDVKRFLPRIPCPKATKYGPWARQITEHFGDANRR